MSDGRRARLFSSLWSRIWVAIFLATAIPLATVFLLASWSTDALVKQDRERSMHRQIQIFSRIVQDRTPGELEEVRESLEAVGTRMRWLPRDGAGALVPETGLADLALKGLATGQVSFGPHTYLYAAKITGDQVLVLLRLYVPPESPWQSLAARIGLAATVAELVALGASLIVGRATFQRARRIVQGHFELAQQGKMSPVPTGGPREWVWLATSLNEMAERLQAAKAAERRFLLSVSHELKSPLTAVRGFAEAQLDGSCPPNEAAEVTLRESRRLERLVQDLLDLARLDESEFQVASVNVDLYSAASAAIQRYAGTAADRKVALRVSGDHRWAQGDPERLVQVIANLVENALNSCRPGDTVEVAVREDRIDVVDTGPGLSEEEQAHAFEPFYLHRRHHRDGKGGNGLGLSIVAELTRAMGGGATVSCQLGEGCRFTVKLPAAAPAGRPQLAEHAD